MRLHIRFKLFFGIILSCLVLFSCDNGNPTKPDTPESPTLASPANTASGIAVTPTLYWNPVSGVTTYRIQVSTNSTFTSTVFDNAALSTTSGAVGTLGNDIIYYWRVNATNTGGTSAWSTIWSFTTVAVPTELEGSWGGQDKRGTDPAWYTYTMKIDSIVVLADGQEKYRGTFTLDKSATPLRIDIRITQSQTPDDIGKTIPALYNLSGNILEITANAPGSARPAAMDVSIVPVLNLILQ